MQFLGCTLVASSRSTKNHIYTDSKRQSLTAEINMFFLRACGWLDWQVGTLLAMTLTPCSNSTSLPHDSLSESVVESAFPIWWLTAVDFQAVYADIPKISHLYSLCRSNRNLGPHSQTVPTHKFEYARLTHNFVIHQMFSCLKFFWLHEQILDLLRQYVHTNDVWSAF